MGAIRSDWTSYQYETKVASSPSMGGDLYVAIGLLPPGGVAGSPSLGAPLIGARMGVDCVKLTFSAPTITSGQ